MTQPESAGFYFIFEKFINPSKSLHLEKWDLMIFPFIFSGKIFSKATEPLKDEGSSYIKSS